MKKLFLFVAVLFLFSASKSFSQYGSSKGRFTSIGEGRTCDIGSSNCGSHSGVPSGILNVNLGGVASTPFYCLDLCTEIATGDSIVDSASTIPQAIYITTTYYPAFTSYPGKLSNNNDEACAVALAIWHFRNNVVISSVSNISGSTPDATIKARADTIIAQTIAHGGGEVHVSTIELKPSVDPDQFYVKTLDTAGNPVAVSNIQLTITGGGSLSTPTVNTNASGISPDVTVTGANNGSVIKAVASVQIPGGVTYCGLHGIKQLLVLGRTTTGLRTATITWGALPVELSSFTANVVNRNVTLKWSTYTETNNAGFDVERSASGLNEWTKVGNVAGNGTSTEVHDYVYSDRNITTGIYTYRLKQIDFNGNFEYHNLNGEVYVGAPTEYRLNQNYPNPFNPSTTIEFDLPADGYVSLKVFNTSGKEVATLVSETKTSGYHSVNFNASHLSSGVYYYRLQANGVSKVMKMALIK